MKTTKEMETVSSYASKVGHQSPYSVLKSNAVDDRSNCTKKTLRHKSHEQQKTPSPNNGKDKGVGHRSPESLEKLMQQEEGETSVTVDEFSNLHANVPFVPQPMFDESIPPPPLGMMAPPRPCPPPLAPIAPAPGIYNHIPPPAIYSQGSPPLPLAGPLQLVYLQQTPSGVNMIPFQAVGFPSFSPCSPLGFPAHPHHPVVVQTPPEYPSGNDLSVSFALINHKN